jgi:hypothetical protein
MVLVSFKLISIQRYKMESSAYKRKTTNPKIGWSNERRKEFSAKMKKAHAEGTWNKKSKEVIGAAISNGLKRANEKREREEEGWRKGEEDAYREENLRVEWKRKEMDIRESERQRMAKKRQELEREMQEARKEREGGKGGETTTLEPFFSDTQIRERLKIRKEKEKERKEEVLDEGSPYFMLNISSNISVRINNCLQNTKIETIGDLIQKSEQDLLKIKYFGRKCLRGIKDALSKNGMSLGKPLSEEKPRSKEERAKELDLGKTLKSRGVVMTQVDIDTWLLFTEYVKQQSELTGIKLVKKTALDIAIKSLIRHPNFFQFALELKKEDK